MVNSKKNPAYMFALGLGLTSRLFKVVRFDITEQAFQLGGVLQD